MSCYQFTSTSCIRKYFLNLLKIISCFSVKLISRLRRTFLTISFALIYGNVYRCTWFCDTCDILKYVFSSFRFFDNVQHIRIYSCICSTMAKWSRYIPSFAELG